ncbi:MAG: hypothetical protein E7173_02115 [Firmicutes bacterium]|nr:hypothetical protein [Bacillota bacterium]
MKQAMDKFISSIKCNKKLVWFLIIIGIISIVFGSIFTVMLNESDKALTLSYINNFMSNISNNNLDYTLALKNGFVNQFSFFLIVWLLGMSVIGIPIILFMYFSKIFILGFSLSAIITNYGFKGCLIGLAYIFPHQIINIILYTILTIFALKIAGKILYCILKKDKIDFKVLLNNYIYILTINLVVVSLTVLFEVYITPKFISIFLSLIK